MKTTFSKWKNLYALFPVFFSSRFHVCKEGAGDIYFSAEQ
jgi:hypothetical protein